MTILPLLAYPFLTKPQGLTCHFLSITTLPFLHLNLLLSMVTNSYISYHNTSVIPKNWRMHPRRLRRMHLGECLLGELRGVVLGDPKEDVVLGDPKGV